MLVYFSIRENFVLAPVEFFMMRVKCPVKVTNPTTQSVYLSEEPLRMKFS